MDFLKTLSDEIQKKFADAIEVLSDGQMLPMPLSRPLPSVHRSLHELRLKDKSGIYRIFYYIKVKDAIYMLHGFKKKTQHLPQHEIDLVRKRIREV